MSKIKTFEDACSALGVDATALPDFSMIPENHRKALLTHYKLVIVAEALNEGWKPDWSNNDECKYTPWLSVDEDKNKPSGFGLSCHGYAGWYTGTLVGSRLCFKSRELARYAVENFTELYEDYMLIG